MVVDAKMDVINVPGLTAKLADEVMGNKLIQRFMLANKAKSTINTLLLDKDETWARVQTSFGSVPQLLQEYLTLAAGAAGIPVSRLLGMAKGKGLGGTEGGGEVDTRNYYDDISSMQRNELSPALTALDEVFIRSTLGSADDSIYYEWTPLWQLSDTEKAAIALQKAQTSQADVTMALINPDALRQARINQLIEDGTYPGLQDAIDEFGAEPEEPTEPSPEDMQAHIGMMQRSASQLQSLGKQAALPAPTTPTTDAKPRTRRTKK
jgi:phage-related protein (TIGR01555 family)